MASTLEDDLCCTVCYEIFEDPVILSCSHSFCKVCVRSWWNNTQTSDCPLCKTHSKELSGNLVLKQLCESFVRERDRRLSAGSGALCTLHAENLKLFCLDHQEPVCVVCRDSRKHSGHRFRPFDEAAQQLREQLEDKVQRLKKSIKQGEKASEEFDLAVRHMKLQARHAEKHIRETFEKLHLFLKEEEEARLAALREEEEQKAGMMKEKTEALKRQIAALSHAVRVTEEELGAEDLSFLLGYKASEERVQQCSPLGEIRLPPGALLQQAKHLGNLHFNIWTSMKNMVSFTPVILDPNTAGPEFLFSQDLTGVRVGARQQLPANPERRVHTVLGSQALGSGTHSWDVQFGDSSGWELGLLPESALNGDNLEPGSWKLLFSEGSWSTISPSNEPFQLPRFKTFPTIRVKLDWDRGRLSFCEPDDNLPLLSEKHTFTQRMFPYIKTVNDFKILPAEFSVRVKEHEDEEEEDEEEEDEYYEEGE